MGPLSLVVKTNCLWERIQQVEAGLGRARVAGVLGLGQRGEGERAPCGLAREQDTVVPKARG